MLAISSSTVEGRAGTWLIEFAFPQRAEHERVVDRTRWMYMMKSAHDAMGHIITQPRMYAAVDLPS